MHDKRQSCSAIFFHSRPAGSMTVFESSPYAELFCLTSTRSPSLWSAFPVYRIEPRFRKPGVSVWQTASLMIDTAA